MKPKHFFLTLLALFASTITIRASYTSVDGIWYNIDASAQTASVSYRGGSFSAYSNEYSDTIVIPSTVTYKATLYSVTSIGDDAFHGCTSLTSVTIPNSVTSIGKFAFSECTGLTSVTIPNSVTSIGYDAFCSCTSLTSVTIPNSVTSIGYEAFVYCAGLTSVNLSKGVKSIGINAFAGCTGLTSVTIPYSVTSIGSHAFHNCSGLTSIVVASGNSVYDSRNNSNAIIETATNTLITGCQNTIIPNSVTSIGDNAFYQCTGLTSVTIPNSVTSIGDYAFYYCSGLTSVTIPNSVTSIGNWAFEGCTGLTSVKLSKGVKSIGINAFAGCTGLTSVTIPNSVTSIGNQAFLNCCSLPVENNLRYADTYLVEAVDKTQSTCTVKEGTRFIGNGAFYGCAGLTSVTIPNSVTSIGNYAFLDCSSLASIEISNSVTSIGDQAFYNCSGLTSLTCEALAPPILGIDVFMMVDRFIPLYVPSESVDLYKAADQWRDFDVRSLSECEIAGTCGANGDNLTWELSCDSILTISGTGDMANSPTWRADSLAIKEVIIHEGVTSIGNSAFHRCRNLISVTIPNSVVSIGSGAFSRSGVVSMTIPSGVTTIGSLAFNNCNSLEVISISNTVTEIREQAFHRCQNLSNIHVDLDNLNYSSVDGILFNKNQTKLIKYPDAKQGEYTIPNSVTEIDIFAFAMCIDLTAVHIPETIDTIRHTAFFECTSLASMRCDAITPPVLDYSVFFHVDCPNIPLYVPVASIDLYKAADQWKEFQILPIERKFQISWVNYDETILKVDSVYESYMPGFIGDTPTKPATAKYTYTFKGWDPEIAAVTGDATYTAQFDSTLIEYEIDTNPGSEPIEGGSVHIDGTPNYGETITLTPIEEDGYVFVEWSDGNNDNPREIVVEGDIAIYPIFHKCEEIIFNIAHTIYKGSSYSFGGKELTVKGLYYDTIPLANGCDSVVELKLSVVKAPNFTLRLVVNNETMGTVTGTGSYKAGTSVTVTATPASSKYIFVRWYNEDVNIDVYENPYTFTLNRNLQLRAVFRRASRKAPKSTSQTK